MGYTDFKFNNLWLSELGGRIQERPPIEIAQREYEVVNIYGKSGDDYIDMGKYKNVEFERKIGFAPYSRVEKEQLIPRLIQWLSSSIGYQAYEDSDHPGLQTEAVITNFDSVIKQLHTIHSATIKFSRKPYWYSKDGMVELEDIGNTNHSILVKNPFADEAYPIYRIQLHESTFSSSDQYVTIAKWSGTGSIAETQVQIKFYLDSSMVQASTRPYIYLDTERAIIYLYDPEERKIISYLGSDDTMKFSGNEYAQVYMIAGANKVDHIYMTPKWRRL